VKKTKAVRRAVCARASPRVRRGLDHGEHDHEEGAGLPRAGSEAHAGLTEHMIRPLVELYGGCMVVLKVS
jgi:hypothetical protein